MHTHEIPPDFPEVEAVQRAAEQLESAMLDTGDLLAWPSADGHYFYSAAPHSTLPDLDALRETPRDQLFGKFNSWQLIRVATPDADGETVLDNFKIVKGLALIKTSHHVPIDILDEVIIADDMERLNAEVVGQLTSGDNKASAMDYANVENALFDLLQELAHTSDQLS